MIMPDLHLELIKNFADESKLPLYISGDTKFLRSMLNVGSTGHLRSKFQKFSRPRTGLGFVEL